ncbi:MAG TPA: hypothetical protein VGF45_02085, partial [Polyangia bacterium]
WSCRAGTCAREPNLLLFWRFEDGSSATATDSSGNNNHGTYVGATGVPSEDAEVPALAHAISVHAS